MSNENDVGVIEFQASQVISKLEEAADKNTNGGGSAWNNPSGFLTTPKNPETILSLIQVNLNLFSPEIF